MTRDELLGIVHDTIAQLAAKVQHAVLENQPETATRWANALAEACAGAADITTDCDDD
jgi:hypothetical protein